MEHHDSFWTERLHALGFMVPDEIVMATTVFLLLATLAIVGGRRLSVERPGGLQQVLEVGIGGFVALLEDIIPHHARRHLALLGTFALFILTSNLFGLLPTFMPPTQSVNVTLALALMSFAYYNVVAIREMGVVAHVKHFMGPVLALSVLIMPIEIIAHLARNLSLSMRLFEIGRASCRERV